MDSVAAEQFGPRLAVKGLSASFGDCADEGVCGGLEVVWAQAAPNSTNTRKIAANDNVGNCRNKERSKRFSGMQKL